MQRTHLLKASLTSIGALALVGASFTGTAFATGDHGKADAPGQQAKAEQQARADKPEHGSAAKAGSGSTWTEDNDTNDGGTPNNVADAGDNRHPSGKDRSVENGGSGNQGKSTSDPDGMKNGGADKPNGPGGIDKADQDGNNGCGNDDDFEDDNNGNCGGKAHVKHESSKPAKAEKPATCTCDHATTTTTAKPAAKPAKGEDHKPAKHESEQPKGKPAKVETGTKDHGSTSCDRRNDEKDQRAVRVEHEKPAKPSTPATPAEVVTPTTTPTTTVAPTTTSTTAPTVGELAVPATVPTCPAGSNAEAAMIAGCEQPVPGQVLAESAVAAPASAETTKVPTQVLAAEVEAPSSSNGGGNVIAAAASGALAFTGSNLLVLLAAAIVTLLVGWALLRADRKQNA